VENVTSARANLPILQVLLLLKGYMTIKRIRFIAILLFVVCLSSCVSSSNLPAGSAADAIAVEGFFRSGIDAFNGHDLELFLRQFGEDIDMYTPTGWLRGKTAVGERFASTFEQFPNVRMELESLKVRSVSKDTVVADFIWRVYPMGKGPAFHGVGSGVYVRRGGSWEEVLEHETVTKIDEGLPGAGQ
jgi:uncharacterized protein (TIGR02246 family)